MPEMKMSRDFLLRGPDRTIRFTANEPIFVTPRCVNKALEYGAEYVDEEDKEVRETNLKKPKLSLGHDELEKKVREVMEEMVVSNIRDEFTASGTPKPSILKARVGQEVPKAMLAHQWTSVKKVAEGLEPVASGN